MNNRHKKNVLKRGKQITSKLSGESCEEKITESAIENICLENYEDPPIPVGYKYICGEWNNGYVIERCSDGSQFVWVPVGSLDSDGTLDGEHFSEKFGRRHFEDEEFFDHPSSDPLTGELRRQIESVKKYGGFYISRYNISKGPEGKPQSVKGVIPCTWIGVYKAKEIATIMEDDNEVVKSHLLFGAEYDSVLAWFMKSKAKTLKEITEDSTGWGNYWKGYKCNIVETGSREEWSVNNIYDFAGNVSEWTQEKLYYDLFEDSLTVIRGDSCENTCDGPRTVAKRFHISNGPNNFTGFRIALYIK